jgi:flagellar hook assembly protein FlgD
VATRVPAAAEDSTMDFNAATPDGPAPSLQVQNARFSPSKSESAALALTLPENGSVEIRVFDASGKSVKLVCDGNYGPGQVSFKFAGKDEAGERLAAGTYYARVMTRWFSRVEALELAP